MNTTPAVASRYASQVPGPDTPYTRGITTMGEAVGAMLDTDCASVSTGEST
jgi:hypothetical protein